jgi:hypothetical protein
VREVKVPGVRWHIGTLGEVADIAEVALVYDLPIVLLVYPVDLSRAAFVHKVKERGK